MGQGRGLGILTRNREPLASGVAYGGVALLWKEGQVNFGDVPIKNEARYEVLICARSVPGHTRKYVVIACYIPPNYDRKRGAGAINFVRDCITNSKKHYKDPYILLAGDFNQWAVEEAVVEYPDMMEILFGSTRESRSIDRFFTNVGSLVPESGTLAPLETEADDKGNSMSSDHRVAYACLELKRREVCDAQGADERVNAYQRSIQDAINRFFPPPDHGA